MTTSSQIVKAAIYPAIGIARVGNSPDEFFIGPEIPWPATLPAGSYKDARGALKRQAARFRVYGLDGRGEVVRELTADDAQITWKVQVANKKAAWYEFDVAMDISQAKPVSLRNSNITDRAQLSIDPGPVTITGKDQSGAQYRFDKGRFLGEPVYLGELRTDEVGRLLFLGGHGSSRSPFGNNPPTTFANNDGWCDDVSDGPVDAEVLYQGERLEVEGAWVATTPPNYAPDLISVQTLWDVIFDTLNGLYVTAKAKPSFMADILPLLNQFSMTQWVNKGFFASYGYGESYDFSDPELLYKLATVTTARAGQTDDQFKEYRQQIFNYFRPPSTKEVDPRMWPWLYGDNMNVPATSPNGYFTVTRTIYSYLQQWAAGDFVQDWDPAFEPPGSLEEIADPRVQAEMLTKAALWFCLGGPFHPGCELTWPMRLPGMYTGPFRIRRRAQGDPEPDPGPVLTPDGFQNQLYFTTPLSIFWNGPGTLTRWMAVPWQTDTASCRAGYEAAYDPYIPTFWPTHVPNHVLAESDYKTVMDEKLPREQRLAAFNRRVVWYRILGENYLDQINNMVSHYGDLGVVEHRPGIADDSAFPPAMYVESPPTVAARGSVAAAVAASTNLTRIDEAQSLEEIPGDRGLTIGPFGRGARRR